MDIWGIAVKVLSGLVALAGLAVIVQGLRAARGTVERRTKPWQGLFLILMVGSSVLPESLNTVRQGMVIAGCLLCLWSLAAGRRAAAP